MEQEWVILAGAKELFLRYGIRSISMDDLARHLSMSKKTLYQFYEDKNSLVTKFVSAYLVENDNCIREFMDKTSNVIEELLRLSEYMKNHVVQINPVVMFDLQKYHREAYDKLIAHKNKVMVDNVTESLTRGMAEGYFRDDLNPTIMARLRVEEIFIIFSGQVFPPDQFDHAELHMQLFKHFIFGCLSDKGKELYNKLEKEYNSNNNDKS